jgi:hypothetical protein
MSDTKVEVDMNRDAPSRVALEMAFYLRGNVSESGDTKAAFLDLYAECLWAARGLRKFNKESA